MSSEQAAGTAGEPQARKWRAMNSRCRRIFGVLIEKAKTTPDAYPLTLTGLVTGCNQKSNREPQMNLDSDEVEQHLEELRAIGAVTEVQGGGRVNKFRHHAYEWLGVDKYELAVMTELLLRGEQTLGELRGRAARMEPIADLAALKPIVDSLLKKELMIALTPAGRGQIVTHNLYKERELVELKAHFANYTPPSAQMSDDDDGPAQPRAASTASSPAAAPGAARIERGITADMLAELNIEFAELRAEVMRLRERVTTLEQKVG